MINPAPIRHRPHLAAQRYDAIMMRARNTLIAKLAAEQARLAELEHTYKEAQAKVESLRARLAASPKALGTPADKVKLFRSLFRGRA